MNQTFIFNRMSQLKSAFEKISKENAENQAALLAAQRKDESSSEMIAELTAVRLLCHY